ncbi:MAG: hypothetical protein PVG63_03395, partial [Anaerolineales bacterium]
QVFINQVEVVIMESMPVQVVVQVSGDLPDGCSELEEPQVIHQDNVFLITLSAHRPTDVDCTEALEPFTVQIPLDVLGLSAGDYIVDVNGTTRTFNLAVDNVPQGEGDGGQPPVSGTAFDEHGISFVLPEGLGDQATIQVMPASGQSGDPAFALRPEHRQIDLTAYPIADHFHQPQLWVFPIAEFEALSEFIGDRVVRMQELLAIRPTYDGDWLPFLPPFNAGPLINARVEYLDFENGSGLRYLTLYGQAYRVINNYELFYTFQGLTDDGQYWVCAILPIWQDSLPNTGDNVPGGDFEAFAENFEAYAADQEANLEAVPATSFTPDLDMLDTFISSILVQ